MSKAKKPPLLKIPLDFKQTVLAALETKPEERKMKKATRKLKSLTEEVAKRKMSLDDLLSEWTAIHIADVQNDRYSEGAKSFKVFLQDKLGLKN